MRRQKASTPGLSSAKAPPSSVASHSRATSLPSRLAPVFMRNENGWPYPDHLKILDARQNEPHRPLRLQRQHDRDRLDMRFHLVAEAAADARRQAAQPRHWQQQALADIGLHAKHGLIGRPKRNPAGGIDVSERSAGLDRQMGLRLRGEGIPRRSRRIATRRLRDRLADRTFANKHCHGCRRQTP